jgi:hypothetical protein
MTKIEGGSSVVAPTVVPQEKIEDASPERETIVAEPDEEVDCWGAEDPKSKGFFATVGGRIGERLDAAVETQRARVEEIREKVQEFSEPIREALKPDPELQQMVRDRAQEIAEPVARILREHDRGDVETTLKQIFDGQLNLVEATRELAARGGESLNYGEFAVRSELVRAGGQTFAALAGQGAELLTRHEQELRGLAQGFAKASEFVKDADEATGVLGLILPTQQLAVRIAEVQLEAMAKMIDGAVTTSLDIAAWAERQQEVETFIEDLENLPQGDQIYFDLSGKLNAFKGAGAEIGAGAKLSVTRDRDQPNIYYVEVERSKDGAVGTGVQVAGAGKALKVGADKTENVRLKFDVNDKTQARDLHRTMYAHAGLMEPKKVAKALEGHVESVTSALELSLSGDANLPAIASVDVGASVTYSQTRRPSDDGTMVTYSAQHKLEGKGGAAGVRLPTGAIDAFRPEQGPAGEFAIDVYRTLMGDQIGTNGKLELSVKTGFEVAEGRDPDKHPELIQRMFIELEGRGNLGPNDISATLGIEIHQPVKLAGVLGLSVLELHKLTTSGSLDLENLARSVANNGRDLSEFVTVTGSARYVRTDGFEAGGSVIKVSAGRKSIQEFKMQIFPPEMNRFINQDAVEATARLMDRHWSG